MADIFSKAKRSHVMSLIKSSGNGATELRMIALLRVHALTGWQRRHRLLGSPDFVWRAERLVLFVDGCFWHGCPRHGHTPRSRQEYWVEKLAGNARRDRRVSRALRADGWTVIRVWECALGRSAALRTARRIASALGRQELG